MGDPDGPGWFYTDPGLLSKSFAMNKVEIDGKVNFLPSEWNELTKDQVIFVSRLFMAQLSVVEFKLRALFKFLALGRKMMKRIDPEDAHYLMVNLSFLLDEVSLTKNLQPILKAGSHRYYGPADGLTNCTFGEFTRVNSLLDTFSLSKDQKYLDEMMAVLYRPKRRFWFVRKAFTDNQDPRRRFAIRTLVRRTRKLKKLAYPVKYSVFLFLSGVLNSLPGKFPYVYKHDGEAPGEDGGWASLIISLADGKTDDLSLETVMNSNLYNVLIGLNKKAKEYHDYMTKIESYGQH
jgi:hypothetical protein